MRWYGSCLRKDNLPHARMKEKPSTRSKKSDSAPTPEKASKGKSATPAAKSKKPADAATASAAKPAKAKTPRAKKTAVAAISATDLPLTQDQIAVAAFLNWCNRRNQGLPDDPFADWISAESEIGLAN